MTVYHVDKYYGNNNEVYYASLPYSLIGTLIIHFGISLHPLRFRFGFNPWYSRYTGFLKWVIHTRFSEQKAEKLAARLMVKAMK